MNTLKSFLSLMLFIGFSCGFVACKKDDPAPVTLTGSTIKDLAADPPTSYIFPPNAPPVPVGITNKYTLFSFKTGAVVPNSDSTSSKWDIGFRSTTIIVNSGTSGPGSAAALVQTGLFDQITTAPDTGYAQDNKASATAPRAIPTGPGKGWYNYDQTTNLVTPKAGVVLIFKTADGKYAKMEIQSYYKGAPAVPTSTTPDRYYTFRYVYQGDGTTKLN